VNPVVEDLVARGLVQDSTDLGALSDRLDAGPLTLYYGCDPSADSLHAGNLIGLLVLRRFADAGHRPIALVGGATGMIGDPGGRSEERNLLDEETLAANVAGIGAQVDAIVGQVADVVDNHDWTRHLSLLEFLRDVGKHVTVNQMLAKESIRSRVDSEHGISYTEFSYMLLQANDYWWLHANRGCELQIGGSDQWGNIVAGVDLIRRRSEAAAHAFTWPLITRADGAKFGKSAEGAVWLAPERTSPYAFFQHWMNVADVDVERFLLQLTLLDVDDIRSIAAEHEADPGRRTAQRRLARELTGLVHGPSAVAGAVEATAVLFGGDPAEAGIDAFETIATEVVTVAFESGQSVVEAMLGTGLASSKSEARRHLAGGAVRVNGERLEDDRSLTVDDLRHDRFVLLRKGKKSYALLDARKDGLSS
jgi:tyrosyl-tRNA synthetase